MVKGNLVRIRTTDQIFPDEGRVGIVIWVDTKYPPRCSVLIGDASGLYDPRSLEVIDDES